MLSLTLVASLRSMADVNLKAFASLMFWMIGSIAYIFSVQIGNPNYLARHRFQLVIARAPNVSYFGQEVSVPPVTAGYATQPTPILNLPVPGGELEYEDLVVSFEVDEDLNNYLEMYQWIIGNGSPVSTQQYADLKASSDGLVSDISLLILDASENAKHSFVFHDAFPRSLSRLAFNSKVDDVEPVYVTVTFKYSRFSIDGVNA